MASYPYLTPLKDYLGNLVTYNQDSVERYCCSPPNGGRFNIERPAKPYNVVGITTTCGDLWCSFTTAISAAPDAPPGPTPLTNAQGDRFLIVDREPTEWFYVPDSVDTLWFFAGRLGSFEAVFVQAPEQMQDAP